MYHCHLKPYRYVFLQEMRSWRNSRAGWLGGWGITNDNQVCFPANSFVRIWKTIYFGVKLIIWTQKYCNCQHQSQGTWLHFCKVNGRNQNHFHCHGKTGFVQTEDYLGTLPQSQGFSSHPLLLRALLTLLYWPKMMKTLCCFTAFSTKALALSTSSVLAPGTRDLSAMLGTEAISLELFLLLSQSTLDTVTLSSSGLVLFLSLTPGPPVFLESATAVGFSFS